MSGVATDTTDDVGSEVALLWTIVLAMADLTAILACLVLIVAQGTVQRGKFTKLIPLELVLPFRDGGSSLDDIVDELLRFVDFFFGIGHDQTM